MKKQIKELAIFVAIPLAVGAISALIAKNGMQNFDKINQPAFAPPGWLFPIVWTILYILMGVASYLVYTSGASIHAISKSLVIYAIQLIVNFFWSIIFFNLQWYLFAFLWVLLLWVLVLATIENFYLTKKVAAYIMIPYLLWVTFACYLTLTIYILN